MADERMIFGAGFSFDGADDDLVKQWQILAPKIEKRLKPLNVSLDFKEINLNNLQDVQKRLKDIKLEPVTPETKTAINSLIRELKSLETILLRLDKYNAQLSKSAQSRATSSSLETQRAARTAEINNRTAQRQAAADRQALRDAELLRAQKARAEQAELRLAAAKEKSINATNRQNTAYKVQSSYLSRLVERMALYFSIGQAMSFLRQVREVTAEFELQRVSLGALIQDVDRASELFSQIKAAAVESPFQIKDLVTYTKQLAAYRIEQESLFEWTQRLADISAGLGIEMGRLILAFGQTRATGYLRGSEVRQFTEAGLPIVEALAEKFSELRGEMVSSAEVFDMISDKAVSFSMVEKVFEDMTDAGGMFYNMQSKQAKTLAGQWSNLIDVMNIAQSEMGEDFREDIEAMINTVKYLWQNWRDVVAITQSVAAGAAAYLIVVRQTTIATKALSAAKALDLALDKAGVANLKVLNPLTMTYSANLKGLTISKRLYVLATQKALMATGVFTKAVWGLTAALLKNPIGLVVAGFVAAGVAIYKFGIQAKSTEQIVEDLNESVSGLKQYTESTGKLIAEFNSLSDKTERTEKESQKLKAITTQLTTIFPQLKEEVAKYGDEVEIVANKVNELYEAERLARQEVAADDNEEAIKRLEKQRGQLESLQATLAKGTKTTYYTDQYGSYLEKEVALTTKDKKKITEQIDELIPEVNRLEEEVKRYQDTIKDLNFIGPVLPEGFEKELAGWQGRILEFKEVLEDKTVIRIFDNEQIQRFTGLNQALEQTAKGYDSAKEELENYEKILKDNSNLSKEEEQQLTRTINRLKVEQSLRHQILSNYQSLFLLETDDTKTKAQIKSLDSQLSLIKEIFKKYKEYSTFKTAEESKTDISNIYGSSLDELEVLLSSIGLDPSNLTYSDAELVKILEEVQRRYKALDDSKKALAVGLEIDNSSFDSAKKNLELKIQQLQEQIDRTELRSDLFKNLLDITGSEELATSLTVSVYGKIEGDLPKTLAETLRKDTELQLTEAFKGIDITKYFLTDNIDYAGLDKLIKELGDSFPEIQKELALQLVGVGLSQQAKEVVELTKSLDLYIDYEKKRANIQEDGLRDRQRINKLSISETEKQILIEASLAKERKDILDLDIKNIKDLQLAFTDPSRLSNSTLKKNLEVLNFALQGITDPEQIKLFKDQMREIEEALFDTFSRPIDIDLGSITESYRKQLYYESKINQAKLEGKEISQEDIDAQILYSKKVQEGLMLYGISTFLSGLEKSADLMKQIADISGDVKLAELGEQLSAFAQNLSAAAEGAQSGGWVGAVIGGGLDIINQSIEAFAASKLQAAQATANVEDFANALELIRLTVDESDFESVFGDSVLGKAAAAYSKSQEALEKYNSEITKTSEIAPELQKEFSSLGAAIFISAMPFAFLKQETNESLVALEAFKKGYNDLQSLAIKTIDNTGWANFWGKQDEYMALGDLAPEIWQDGIFNVENAQAFLDTNKNITEEQRKQVQQAIDYASAYEEAMEIVDEAISDTFGSLASDLTDVIWDSVANGTNAWDDFKNVGSEAISALGKQMLQEFIMTAYLDQYRDSMRDAFAEEDPAVAMRDVMQNIFANMGTMITGSQEVAQEWIEWMKQNGFDTSTDTGLQGISKEFAQASESAILGLAQAYNTNNFYVARIDMNLATILMLLQAKYGTTVTSSFGLTAQQENYLSSLPSIAQNTASTVSECQKIVRQTKRVADSLESVIKPIGTPASKAIKTM